MAYRIFISAPLLTTAEAVFDLQLRDALVNAGFKKSFPADFVQPTADFIHDFAPGFFGGIKIPGFVAGFMTSTQAPAFRFWRVEKWVQG